MYLKYLEVKGTGYFPKSYVWPLISGMKFWTVPNCNLQEIVELLRSRVLSAMCVVRKEEHKQHLKAQKAQQHRQQLEDFAFDKIKNKYLI